MQPTISVIIPTHNRQKQLIYALDSVYAQTHPVTEVLVIDDGSSDDTQALISHRYPQVRYFYQPQQGVSAARNRGIQHAKGEWIALLDSDDRWQPHKIEQQINALQAHPEYWLCHTDEWWVRHGNRVNPMNKHQKYGGWIFPHCVNLCLISPSSVLIHSNLLANVGIFDSALPACEDYDLWLRITAHFPVLYLDKPLIIKYGGHEDQLSTRYWGMDRFRIYALEKIIKQPSLCDEYREIARCTLTKKVRIYLNGAKKRNKINEITYYESLLKQYK